MSRQYAIAQSLIMGDIKMDDFEAMLECAYGDGMRKEQLILQAAAELAGPRFERLARAISDFYL